MDHFLYNREFWFIVWQFLKTVAPWNNLQISFTWHISKTYLQTITSQFLIDALIDGTKITICRSWQLVSYTSPVSSNEQTVYKHNFIQIKPQKTIT